LLDTWVVRISLVENVSRIQVKNNLIVNEKINSLLNRIEDLEKKKEISFVENISGIQQVNTNLIIKNINLDEKINSLLNRIKDLEKKNQYLEEQIKIFDNQENSLNKRKNNIFSFKCYW